MIDAADVAAGRSGCREGVGYFVVGRCGAGEEERRRGEEELLAHGVRSSASENGARAKRLSKKNEGPEGPSSTTPQKSMKCLLLLR